VGILEQGEAMYLIVVGALVIVALVLAFRLGVTHGHNTAPGRDNLVLFIQAVANQVGGDDDAKRAFLNAAFTEYVATLKKRRNL
jgi:hypothetical protein